MLSFLILSGINFWKKINFCVWNDFDQFAIDFRVKIYGTLWCIQISPPHFICGTHSIVKLDISFVIKIRSSNKPLGDGFLMPSMSKSLFFVENFDIWKVFSLNKVFWKLTKNVWWASVSFYWMCSKNFYRDKKMIYFQRNYSKDLQYKNLFESWYHTIFSCNALSFNEKIFWW